MRQPSEPSVEEILESIKKVIARDNRVGAAEERRERTVRGMAPKPSFSPAEPAADEVLDLAETAEYADEDPAATDLADQLADDLADNPTDEPADPAPLIADQAVSSMRESLAALATMAAPGVPPQIVRSGETSLEGLVREMLRPMLADWLDKNLPPLVERLVATEIARIVGKKL